MVTGVSDSMFIPPGAESVNAISKGLPAGHVSAGNQLGPMRTENVAPHCRLSCKSTTVGSSNSKRTSSPVVSFSDRSEVVPDHTRVSANSGGTVPVASPAVYSLPETSAMGSSHETCRLLSDRSFSGVRRYASRAPWSVCDGRTSPATTTCEGETIRPARTSGVVVAAGVPLRDTNRHSFSNRPGVRVPNCWRP